MTITLHLQPETERSLLARAHAEGVSLNDLAQDILTREAASQTADVRTGAVLIEAMRACPYPEVDLEPTRVLSPFVRDVVV